MPLQPFLPGLSAPETPSSASHMSASLLHYPDVRSDVLCENAKTLGHAAELLVESVFARLGVPAASFAEYSRFDRMIWIGSTCLRVQIKGRHRMTGGAYHFDIKRGYQRGPTGTRDYDQGDFDLLALVGLPDDVVKFTARWARSHVIRCEEIHGLRAYPGASLRQALVDLDVNSVAGMPAPT